MVYWKLAIADSSCSLNLCDISNPHKRWNTFYLYLHGKISKGDRVITC